MRVKTACRRHKAVEETPEPRIPEATVDDAEAEPVTTATAEAAPDVEPADAAAQAMAAATKADAAKYALLQQVEALRQSEAMQRQHRAAMMTGHQGQPTRQQRLALWRSQGMSEAEAHFVNEHLEMIDHPQVLQHAVAAAVHAGIERDSPEFLKTVETKFDETLRHLKAQGAAQSPAFFQPPAAPPHSTPSPTSFTSAPVSRGDVGSYREPSPSRVKLTPDELQIAAASGITPVEYARNKQRLAAEKKSGQRP